MALLSAKGATAFNNGVTKLLQFLVLSAMLIVPVVVSAQAYPTRNLTFVVSVPAGGSIDAVARMIAVELTSGFGQPVIVEPRPGAGGNIAAEYVARAPADGYTLLIASSSTFTTNPHIYRSLPFDPEKSFAPIVIPARVNMSLVVHPKLNVSTLAEFIALLRAQPGNLNFGSGGNGTQSHLAGEIFGLRTHTRANHVPYKGIAPALTDLLAGRIDFMFDSATAVPYIVAGKLRALAVVGPNRLAALPNISTFKETGIYDMEVANGWYAIVTTAGTPTPIVQRLNAEIVRILRMPSIQERISSMGLEPSTSTPEELAASLRSDLTAFGQVIKQGNIKQ